MSRIINPDGLKSPILSDELNLLRINGISMLVRVDYLILSIDTINYKVTEIKFITSHNMKYKIDCLPIVSFGMGQEYPYELD